MRLLKKNFFFFTLFAILFAAYIYGIHYLPLRGEEANRILTAYEMHYFGDYFNLTHLGEPYYSKPPLFMWIVLVFSSFLGWSQETARLISVFSVFLTSILIYFFTFKLFRDRLLAFISAVILLTLGDLLFFYGFVAEIDAFHMFLFTTFIVISYVAFSAEKDFWAFSLAGLFTALLFLTKGLPAFYHAPITFLILLIYFNKWRLLFSEKLLAGLISLIIPLGIWFSKLKNPNIYLLNLWEESFQRTPLGEDKLFLIAKHLLFYPLLNFRQLLPHSFYTLLNLKRVKEALILYHKRRGKEILLLLAIVFLNYLPYLISPGARGRYILIIFPFIGILFSLVLKHFLLKRVEYNKFYGGILILLLLTGWLILFPNIDFFYLYGLVSVLIVGIGIILAFFILYKEKPNWLIFTTLLLTILKFGYINYYAPFKEKKHPSREIALKLSKVIPKGAVIRYLPRKVNMELCAYTDMFTRGIVLRKRGDYFLTREGELPEGHFKILKTYKGWVVGIFLQKGR